MNLKIQNTFDRVFYNYGFKIKRRAYDVTSYYNKEKDMWGQLDERLRTVEVNDIQLNFSITELDEELKKI
jgi:hypothetical protein